MVRRAFAILLWLVYAVLVGIGGWVLWHASLPLYILYLPLVWLVSVSVVSALAETLWD